MRQREASAIMEVIQSGKLPEQVSWQVTSGINTAKDNLKESGVYQGAIDKKIDHIITQPMLREQQGLLLIRSWKQRPLSRLSMQCGMC